MSEVSFRDLLIGTWTGKGDGGAEIVIEIKDDGKFSSTITEVGWLDKAIARALGDTSRGTWSLDGHYFEFRHKMSESRAGKLYRFLPVVGPYLTMVYDFFGIGPTEGAKVTHLCCTHLLISAQTSKPQNLAA
jgi:hypothetical protein